MPARAITVYTILLMIAAVPPKSHATKSNWNIPTRPQFKAPMIIKARQILSNIFSTPFSVIFLTKISNLFKKIKIMFITKNRHYSY